MNQPQQPPAAPADTSEYRARMEADWTAFTTTTEPLADRWARYAVRSRQWRQTVVFGQPVGLDYPTAWESLEPLLEELRAIDGVDVPPLEWFFLNIATAGYLMPTDISWSQVESLYVNAAPRIHRLEPFELHFGGISATDEALYLGVEEGLALRGVRRQLSIGVTQVRQWFKEDPWIQDDGDHFVPRVEFAFFAPHANRRQIIEAVQRYRTIDLGSHPVTHIKMARLSADPQIHYPPMDVIAEIGMLGENARKGYHT